MDKLTNWIVLIIGVLFLLPLLVTSDPLGTYGQWIIGLGVLVIGIKGLMGK